MSDADTQIRRRPTRRWVGIALVASLCVNFLLIGAAASFAWKHRDGDRDFSRFALHRIMRALPNDQREAARTVLEAQRPAFQALRQEIRDARSESMALLTADPLDEAALRASIEHARGLTAQRRAMTDDIFLDFAVKLSAADREELAQRFRHRRRDGRRERREGE